MIGSGIKLILTDLDSTLLRRDKTISSYTKSVFEKCRAKGILTAFATARPKRAVMGFAGEIMPDALILHNGALVYADGERLYHQGICRDDVLDTIRAIKAGNPATKISVEMDDALYANFDLSEIWNFARTNITDFTDLPMKPAEKIIIGISSADDAGQYGEYLSPGLYMEVSEGKLGLIMHRGVAKHNAAAVLLKHYGLDASDAAAFGDDYNDIGMLRFCGIGVAMENALEDVKAVADCICAGNDSDGVAKWIEENILFG